MKRRGSTAALSFLLLLSVFFLPLHYHPLGTAAQITKDCSCVHGTRTEVGLTSASVGSTLVFTTFRLTGDIQDSTGSLLIASGHIRAPPLAVL